MIATMTKVQLAAPARLEDKILRWLQEKEILHVTTLSKETADEQLQSKIDLRLARVQFALEFIVRIKAELHRQSKRNWRDMFAGKPVATLDNLEQTLQALKLEALLKKVHSVSDVLADLQAQQHEITEQRKVLQPWRELDIQGASLQGSQQVRHLLLTVSLQEELLVKERLQNIPTLVLQEVRRIVERQRGTVYIEAVLHRSDEEAVNRVVAETNAELVTLVVPDKRTITQHYQQLTKQLAELKTRYQQTLRDTQSFIKLERQLQFAYDALSHRRERVSTGSRMVHLPLTIVMSGWVPRSLLANFSLTLEREFPAATLAEVTPAKDEVPPVTFDNRAMVQPFEVVTDIFGKPGYHELDPSPLLAVFFLIAFGLALTDAGYGLLMMGLMWAAGKFFRLKRGMRKMTRLLFFAGASTTLFGLLTGGWFGINLEALPASGLRDILLWFKVVDPIGQTITLLMVALAFGVVQLLFAWAIRGYDHARKGNIFALFFDDIAWITMVIFILLYVGSQRGIIPVAWEGALLVALLINVTALVLTQGRAYKNPILKLGGGVLSLYRLMGFLSDTLSYSRLLALGLATGVIASVVNLIGSMVAAAIPGVGWLLAAVVLVGGHLFNLSINALGAFIHSGRLQFVEFFPKFLSGGGKPYKPMGLVGHYVDNPREFI